MATMTTTTDRCDHCGKEFNDGEGVSGYTTTGTRRDYDFTCALELGLAVDSHGELYEVGSEQESEYNDEDKEAWATPLLHLSRARAISDQNQSRKRARA